jgi:hypothetical protein
MFKKSFLIAAIIAVSPVAFASHDSPPVNVPGVTIPPLTTVKMPMTGAGNPGEAYSLACDIMNPNYAKQYPIVLSMGGNSGECVTPTLTITLNGAPLNDGQGQLNRPDNSYTVSPVRFSTSGDNCTLNLTFTSWDNSDTATVTNCIATPIVQ